MRSVCLSVTFWHFSKTSVRQAKVCEVFKALIMYRKNKIESKNQIINFLGTSHNLQHILEYSSIYPFFKVRKPLLFMFTSTGL